MENTSRRYWNTPLAAGCALLFTLALLMQPAAANAEEVAPATAETPGLADRFNGALDQVNGLVFKTLFFDVSFGAFKSQVIGEDGQPVLDEAGQPTVDGPSMPFLVAFLGFGAIFYTFYHGFINIRGFKHAIEIVRGKWAASDDEGDIHPFKALTSALSATVGLGNIAGVAVAMVAGGPGALFWMMVLGLFGMTSKFHETTLSQMYRVKNEDGTISGGPMYFLDQGFKDISPALWPLGKLLAIIFAIFLMGAALGGGNMFQSNQAYEGFFSQFVQPYVAEGQLETAKSVGSYGFGLLMASIVAIVVIGGITRIGAATSVIVPFMAVLYVLACLVIIVSHAAEIPAILGQVFAEAFAMKSAFGGFIGVMMVGFQRAAFSSEAGIGSSAIAHSAAKTDEPIREGLVASLEPFIDTIVICFMTGMVVLITGAYKADVAGGAAVTLHAFEQKQILADLKFPWILAISIILFAFSTMISWCYYGERAWGYLFGLKSVIIFRLAFVVCVFIGAVASLGSVIDSADAMLLSCALPNIFGGIILAPKVGKRLKVYWAKYKAGELKPGEPMHLG